MHLTGKGMLTIQGRRARKALLVSCCLLALLSAATLQAAHICSVPLLEPSSTTQIQSNSINAGVCLTCLMAQVATSVVIFLALTPLIVSSRRLLDEARTSRASYGCFKLYVRPPPLS